MKLTVSYNVNEGKELLKKLSLYDINNNLISYKDVEENIYKLKKITDNLSVYISYEHSIIFVMDDYNNEIGHFAIVNEYCDSIELVKEIEECKCTYILNMNKKGIPVQYKYIITYNKNNQIVKIEDCKTKTVKSLKYSTDGRLDCKIIEDQKGNIMTKEIFCYNKCNLYETKGEADHYSVVYDNKVKGKDHIVLIRLYDSNDEIIQVYNDTINIISKNIQTNIGDISLLSELIEESKTIEFDSVASCSRSDDMYDKYVYKNNGKIIKEINKISKNTLGKLLNNDKFI